MSLVKIFKKPACSGCSGVYYDLEYENMFVESAISSGGIGATMTRKTKRIGCSNMKDLLEQNGLEE